MGRTIEGCERKGKKWVTVAKQADVSFWLKLSGEGRLPVLHFGMTGMVQVSERQLSGLSFCHDMY
jgi:formamidopyrimidine-DNA glycosylase